MLYIVTGATGHVGYNLVRLLKENHHRVRALVLPGDDISKLEQLDVNIIFGDITDKNSIYDLLDVSDTNICLIHTAGIISIDNKPNKLLDLVNVTGTKNIIDIAIEKKVNHIIYTSSVHAIKEEGKKGLIKETEIFDESLVVGAYAKSKATATKYVIEKYKEGHPITIVHPAGVIGPYDFNKGHMTKLIEKYLNKSLGARVSGGYNFVDVRDVVDAIYQLSQKHIFGTFILSGHYVSLKEFFESLRQISGRKRRLAVFANGFIRLLAPIIELHYRLRKKPPLFTAYSLYTLQSNSNFSNEKIKSAIDYNPRNIKDTLYDTSLWLIEEKHLKHNKIIDYIKSKLGMLPFIKKRKKNINGQNS